MAWSDWIKNDNGSESKVKVEKDSSGETRTHFLNSGGGSRENHTHVIVREHKDGGKSAHCVPHKANRK
jgi:hypothetical protein